MMHNTGIKSGSAEIVTGALSVEGPQPVWMTLNEARERAFTGEVVFEIDPEVLAYFDQGVVYYAERVSDMSLGCRLLEAGVIDASQLERGTVRVGDVEHLGRLFDRDATVDRDAVLVVTETSTQDLIADLANREISTVRVTAYRHHPSGVHRWFVAPFETGQPVRPVADVAQIGGSTVDDLPARSLPGIAADEMTIEWNEPFDGIDPVDDGFSPSFDQFVLDLASTPDLDEDLDDLVAVEPLLDDGVADDAAEDFENLDDFEDFEFAVVWPDGSEEVASEVVVDQLVDDTEADELLVIDELTETPDEFPVPTLANGEVRFEIPSLAVEDVVADADTEVSDDVADAVRRAIAAIESATIENPVVATADPEPATAPASWSAFAPPTMEMRAEVLYGLEEAEVVTEVAPEVADEGPTAVTVEEHELVEATVEQAAPALGVASVVFVDDEAQSGGTDERSSALRRLIGSLRRKDR